MPDGPRKPPGVAEHVALARMAQTPPLPPIERLQAVQLQPGDILVVTVPADTTSEQAHHLVDDLKTRFPDQDVLIVAGVQLDAMRPVLDIGGHVHASDWPERVATAKAARSAGQRAREHKAAGE